MKSEMIRLTLAAVFSLTSLHAADALEQSLGVEKARTDASAKSQEKVDGLDEQRGKLFAAYKEASAKLESARTYNEQLREMIASQQEETLSLNRQLEEIDATSRGVMPMMKEMVDSLEQFVALDLPFLTTERAERIEKIKEKMRSAGVSVSEKYRIILEAYGIENEYGRTIEAYRDKLPDGRVVDFLRIGRIGLYYRTLSGDECGMWDKAGRTWAMLDSGYDAGIKEGIKVAKKQSAPTILELPVPTAKESK